MKSLCLLLTTILLAGCSTLDKRELDPEGAYLGDQYLWKFDGVLLDYSDTTNAILDLADRHPVLVAENDGFAEFVTDLRVSRKKTLRDAKAARDLYLATKGAERGEIDTLEAVMEIVIRQVKRKLVELSLEDQASVFKTETEREAA